MAKQPAWRQQLKPMVVDPEVAARVSTMVEVRFDEDASIPLDYFIREVLQQAMVAAHGRQVNAGKLLGMSQHQIAYAIPRYSVDPRKGRPAPIVRVPRIVTETAEEND